VQNAEKGGNETRLERTRRPWQNLNDKDFGDGFGFEPRRPPEDTEIVGRATETLLDVLKHVAAVSDAIATAALSYKAQKKAAEYPTLARPAKPEEQEAEAILAEALAWAKTYQSAHLQMHRDSKKFEEKLAVLQSAMAPLHEVMSALKDARIPQQDAFRKDIVCRAYEQLSKYVKGIPDQQKYLIGYAAPYSLEAPDSQTQRDTANNLRNLMRKALFAIGQSESAQASLNAAKAEKVPQAEVNAPVLTQSSVSAFVNTHARMCEINGRNQQRKDTHTAKVGELEKQCRERASQAKQAVGAVLTARRNLHDSKVTLSAGLDAMVRVAHLFDSAYNK